MQARLAKRRLVLDQAVEHRFVAGPDLFEEQRVHHLRRAHHVRERFALVGRQARDVGSQVGRRKSRGLRLEIRDALLNGRRRRSRRR